LFPLGAKHVQIIAHGGRGGVYVEANAKTNFSVIAATDESIPSETTYRWHVVSTDNHIEFEKNTALLSYTFPVYGHYDLSVIGNHSAGSFSAQIGIKAESKLSLSLSFSLSLSPLPPCILPVDYLHSIVVSYIPTVRSGGPPAMALVSARLNSSQPYEGPFTYHLVGENGENFTDVIMTETDGSLKISFMPSAESNSKDVRVTFVVKNHISSYSTVKSVGVVGELH
jgi:hypothetical protein